MPLLRTPSHVFYRTVNITKWAACITFFIYFSIVSCTLNMHVLTRAVTNIKHVYITNKTDRISKWIHGSTSLIVATIHFWITGPFESRNTENLSEHKQREEFPRQKNKTWNKKSFLYKACVLQKWFREKISSLFYFLKVFLQRYFLDGVVFHGSVIQTLSFCRIHFGYEAKMSDI